MNNYLQGCDVLGADDDEEAGSHEIVGAADGGAAVLITIPDIPSLLKAKSGAAAEFINAFTPGAIAGKVYGDIRDKIDAGMKNEGVQANVKVISTLPPGAPPRRDLLVGMGLGVGGLGVGYGIVKLVKHFIGRRK